MPFGDDAEDVPSKKMIRRIDKHTAAQLGVYLGRPASSFDLHNETRRGLRQNSLTVSTARLYAHHGVEGLTHVGNNLAHGAIEATERVNEGLQELTQRALTATESVNEGLHEITQRIAVGVTPGERDVCGDAAQAASVSNV